MTGPAGSGKTYSLLNDFEQTLRQTQDPLAEDFFFLVPSLEHTERIISLMAQREIKGFFHHRVTTLSRLIVTAFGIPDDGVATNVIRYLIVREILEKENWPYFEGVQKSPGFLNLMLSFILELKESLISAARFREKMNGLKRLEPDLAVKYEALAGIYEAYEQALSMRGLRDRQDALEIYRERKKAGIIKNGRIRKIWMDGFFDFSELQLAYIRELCEITEEVTITLTLEDSPGRQDLFSAPRRTEGLLMDRGFRRRVAGPRAVSKRRPEVLGYLEKNIFSVPKPDKKIKSSEHVEIFEAIGMEGEIEMIARAIETQQRRGGYRFSDFAVLLRQIGDYDHVIRSIFNRYQIPVEIHERERLEFSPIIQVVVRLLNIFLEGWKRWDLMEFLKSSYVRFLGADEKDYEWVSRLEHAAMTRGVFRDREAWLRLDAARGRLEVLAQLEDELRGAAEFSELKRILTHAAEKTFGLFEYVDSVEGYVRRDAACHRRFLSILDEIEISSGMPRKGRKGLSEISVEQFAERFFRLVELDLYSLHERDKNRVQVYDISLARQKEYRVVFVAGLLEKRFPVQIKEDPVLSDWERELLNGLGEGVLKERLASQGIERYFFYLALTRATEKLILTYPRLDFEGKESLPSYYVEELRSLFAGPPLFKKQELGRPYPALRDAVNERELELGVMGALWTPEKEGVNPEPLLLYLTNRLLERKSSREKIRRAFHKVTARLTDSAIADTGTFRPLRTSATGLEEYAKCPFRYFADKVLNLQDPEEDRNVMTRGTVLHDVLEHCFRDWMAHPAVLKDKDKAKKQALRELEKSLERNPLLLEKRYQYDLDYEDFRETLERFLDTELERLETAKLKPRYFEFNFGLAGSGAGPLVLGDGAREICISGKIDRIDVDANNEIGFVIDYKRRAKFEKKDLEFGVHLQLPIYCLALETLLGLKAAAGELYSIKERKKNGFYHADHIGLLPGLSRRRMILPDKDFRALLERSVFFIRKFSQEMGQMRIAVEPRKCEPYCPYASLCRIEKWRLTSIAEEIKVKDKEEQEVLQS